MLRDIGTIVLVVFILFCAAYSSVETRFVEKRTVSVEVSREGNEMTKEKEDLKKESK